jgi:predicted  nucleic acid-binding Zn-ribbon protein
MKMNKIIIIITMFVFSVSLSQNTTILFLRDGSIIQGTITHEKPNKIFLKTEMGFVQIKPEDIIGREDLAKKGDLTYMSDQIEFVRRYVENLSGKTVSWKDSLQNKIDNLYQVYKGFEILQQEFEADLLRLHTKDQEKSKQLLEITHDIVEHEVDISLNRQNIGLVGDTIGYINNGLSVAEDNLAKNINQTFVLSGSTANMMDDIDAVSNEITNNKSQIDIMSGSVANLYREVQRVEKSFEFINRSIKENRGSIGLNQESINANHNAIIELGNSLDKKIDALHDSLKVSQNELVNTMELLWKQNKKSVNDINETFNDSLYSVNRRVKTIDTKVGDVGGDLEVYITELKASIENINKAIATINGSISGIERNVDGVSSKLEALSTQVSKIKKK